MNLRLILLCCIIVILNDSVEFKPNLSEDPVYPSLVLGQDYNHIQCYADPNDVHFIASAPLLKDLAAKGGGNMGDFEVRYVGFTQEARDAFQFAVDIWDMLLDSPSKIIISANFTDLGSGVLGSAAPTEFYRNFDPKADPNIDYAGPIAEKIAGRSLNGSASDLSCNFNEAFNWSFDYQNPQSIQSGQYDFVSVVLHELAHGLGFLSLYAIADNQRRGFIRGSQPEITDIFSLVLEDNSGENLFLNYEEASTELGIPLTGNNLFFNSHTVPNTPLPKIYAPNPWDGGSSLSHLDEIVHAGPDGLMTPNIGAMEVQHDPALSLTLLYDMGWLSTFVVHQPSNLELLGSPIPIQADIHTNIGMDSSGVKLIFSQDSFQNQVDTIPMLHLDGTSSYTAYLPHVIIPARYQYYIAVDDSINQRLRSPRLAVSTFHEILVGEDLVPPTIQHNPVETFFLNDELPDVMTEVEDAFMGVDEVLVEYKVKDGPIQSISLMENSEIRDQYLGTLNFDTRGLKEGDIISYRIIADDLAIANNMGSLPSEGWFDIKVKAVPDAVDYYFNDFNEASEDFKSLDFTIRSEEGFRDGALHSQHPYVNAGSGNELNFIVELRTPIEIIARSAKVEFDEVVLVEPGEQGSAFGDDDFWDYVIVEASENNGANWIPLGDGYDSDEQSSWRSRYDAGVSGQNSTSVGDDGLFIRRSIDLYNESLGFTTGDVVLLRWRLFSDPFATGWGWVIDNLEIQKPQTTPVTTVDIEDLDIRIAPNPIINNRLRFEMFGSSLVGEIRILDSNGRIQQQYSALDSASGSWNEIDISRLGKGVFYAVFQLDDRWITKPFLKVH
ncbi:MAG: zinc-dependent metalloprotease [Bacteroidia bacterium]|nr:zinc-dependent metalloprotease [Bacteroidia bacterium]